MKKDARTRSAAFHWGTGHVPGEAAPDGGLREELAFSRRCLERLRVDNKAMAERVAMLSRQLDMRNSETAQAREERDHARRMRAKAEASLSAVSVERDGALGKVEALESEIDALRRKYADLKRENTALRRRLKARDGGESPFGKAGAPSLNRAFKANSTQDNQARRGGAKQGHTGHGRRQFGKTGADARHETCLDTSGQAPCCSGMRLTQVGERVREYDRYIPARTEHVVAHIGIFKCGACGKVMYARPGDVLKRMSYSNAFLAAGAVKFYVQGHTAGDVERELGVGEGTFFSMMDTVADKLLPAFEEIKLETARQANVHVDETTWWLDGVKGYSWVFHNRNVELHLFPGIRSSSVPAEFFGYAAGKAPAGAAGAPAPGDAGNATPSAVGGAADGGDGQPCAGKRRRTPLDEAREYEGKTIVNSDRFSGYSPLDVRHQYCFEHLKRDLDKLLDCPPEKEEELDEVKRFHGALRPLLAESMRLCANAAVSDGDYYGRAREIKEKIRDIVFAEARNPGVQGYQDIWREKWDSLFEWADDRRIKCDNNAAERAIRPTVIARKISLGSQGRNGARNREIITSVLMTVRIRGGDPCQWLVNLLDALARNPSHDVAAALPMPDMALRKKRRVSDTSLQTG